MPWEDLVRMLARAGGIVKRGFDRLLRDLEHEETPGLRRTVGELRADVDKLRSFLSMPVRRPATVLLREGHDLAEVRGE